MNFYAAIPPQYWKPTESGSFLVSAGTWYKDKFTYRKLESQSVIIDSGGFKFRDYPFTIEQYIEWAQTFNPLWIACFDVVGDKNKTLELWSKYKHLNLVPVAQGHTVEDYLQCLEQYRIDGAKLAALGGIKNNWDIARKVIPLSPLKLHLFGAGLSELSDIQDFRNIISSDSANWSGRFAHGLEVYKQLKKTRGWTQAKTAVDYFLAEYRQKVEKITSKNQLFLDGF